jgi:fused signal recognition particle receptor
MDVRRWLEELGIDIRGFLEGLGVDVAALESAVGLEVEVMAVALTGLLAVLLAFVGTRAVMKRRRAAPAGPASSAEAPSLEATEAPKPARRATDAEAIRRGLAKTRGGFLARLDALLGRGLDDELVEELETLLVTSDLGIHTAQRLIAELEQGLSKEERQDPAAIKAKLRERVAAALGEKLEPWALPHTPTVVMVIGVNGVGKTTTIGKLAARYVQEGKKVMLAAGDTFRAAAVEQLEIWGERAGAPVVKGAEGADPASVMYAAVEKARAEGVDLLLCDTAGRLQTKVNLMNELAKVKKVLGKAMEGAPHEVLMVLDATTGQNAISQAQKFSEAVTVDSLALTKLDGTAKGGVVVAIADELGLPVRFVGVGEQIDDLRDFDPVAFVDALFAEEAPRAAAAEA